MKTWKWLALAAIPLALVAATVVAAPKQAGRGGAAKRGEYLVTIGGCNDCHTPFKMGPNGPEKDTSMLLAGHPQGLEVPAPPPLSPPWGGVATATFTAWSGPWGTTFTANLTPDPETGLGKWTLQNFIESMRTGRHMGRGRQILPPMPWQAVGAMTDDDLKAVWAYLRSIPAIKNKVPDPRPPEQQVQR